MSTRGQTAAWKESFLTAFRELGNVTEAAKVAGVPRRRVYRWLQQDAHFREAFADAEVEAVENLEAEAYRRAVTGVDEPVFGSLGQGLGSGEVGTVRKFSDTLLIFLLKGRAPEKYRERSAIEHTGKGGGPIVTRDASIDLKQLSDEELGDLDRLVRKATYPGQRELDGD